MKYNTLCIAYNNIQYLTERS